jgi:hypothetical protein
MGLIPIVKERYLREELAGLLGGIYHNALGDTSLLPTFLVKDQVKLILVLL